MADATGAVVGQLSWLSVLRDRATTWRPRDPLRWSRFRWLAITTVWAIGSVCIGALLALGGERVILAQGAWAVYANIAGTWGIRASGACLLILGLLMVACLGAPWLGYPEPQLLLRRGLRWLFYYYAWCWVEFLLAPLAPGGAVSWLGICIFPMLASVPLVLSLKGPPELVPRGESLLIQAVIDEGGDREFAKRLALRLYGGSDEGH